jgi:hypothetical protein
MKTIQVHMHLCNGSLYVTGKVDIPGVGELEVKDCLSLETVASVFSEVQKIARTKLGMAKEMTDDKNTKDI